MGIVELMLFVDEKTNYLNAFTHIATTKQKSSVDKEDLVACILANGTNYGLYKMANISDRSMGKLRSVNDSYIRYETLKESNDQISNAIAILPILYELFARHNYIYRSFEAPRAIYRPELLRIRIEVQGYKPGAAVGSDWRILSHKITSFREVRPLEVARD